QNSPAWSRSSSSLQCAPDRGLAALALPREHRHRLASGITLGDLLPLAGVEHERATELRALGLRPLDAGLTTLADPRTTSGTRLSFGSATTRSSSSTPLRPTGAMTSNSARGARIPLITAVCWRDMSAKALASEPNPNGTTAMWGLDAALD